MKIIHQNNKLFMAFTDEEKIQYDILSSDVQKTVRLFILYRLILDNTDNRIKLNCLQFSLAYILIIHIYDKDYKNFEDLKTVISKHFKTLFLDIYSKFNEDLNKIKSSRYKFLIIKKSTGNAYRRRPGNFKISLVFILKPKIINCRMIYVSASQHYYYQFSLTTAGKFLAYLFKNNDLDNFITHETKTETKKKL